MQWNLKNWKEWEINSANQALEQRYIKFIYPLGQTCLLLALDSSYISASLHILNHILKNKKIFGHDPGVCRERFWETPMGFQHALFVLFKALHLGRQNTLSPQHNIPSPKQSWLELKYFPFTSLQKFRASFLSFQCIVSILVLAVHHSTSCGQWGVESGSAFIFFLFLWSFI